MLVFYFGGFVIKLFCRFRNNRSMVNRYHIRSYP